MDFTKRPYHPLHILQTDNKEPLVLCLNRFSLVCRRNWCGSQDSGKELRAFIFWEEDKTYEIDDLYDRPSWSIGI